MPLAKHIVICKYCHEKFDANKEEFIKPASNRYAHKSCYEKYQKELSQEEKDKKELEEYIKKLFKTTTIDQRIYHQIDKYIKEYKYTYSGIHRSLIYFYEIKKGSIEKANGGLGIVPYIYQEAYNYYYNIWLAQQKNENKVIEDYTPNEIVITIVPPERKQKRRKLFNFLDL